MPTSVFSPEYALFLEMLKRARKERKVTQYQIAERLGKPQSYVSKCQTGERRIDIVELSQLCDAIGVPFADFARDFEEALKKLKS